MAKERSSTSGSFIPLTRKDYSALEAQADAAYAALNRAIKTQNLTDTIVAKEAYGSMGRVLSVRLGKNTVYDSLLQIKRDKTNKSLEGFILQYVIGAGIARLCAETAKDTAIRSRCITEPDVSANGQALTKVIKQASYRDVFQIVDGICMSGDSGTLRKGIMYVRANY